MKYPVIPLRALEHYSYCSRQAAIIHVDDVWRDNAHTVRGIRGHRRADHAPTRLERGRRSVRGLELWSEALGLVGRADVVEIHPDGEIQPVEYKAGRRHGRSAEIQLCAQALCLEEMLSTTVAVGHVWYAGLNRRHRIHINDELRDLTHQTIESVRSLFSQDRLPPPANDARCSECQLLGYCLPSVVSDPKIVEAYLTEEVWACSY